VAAQVLECAGLRVGDRDLRGPDLLEQAGARVHRAHVVVHRRQLLVGRVHHDVEPVVEGPELEVRHDDGQLDDHVATHVEAGHLEVEPDESVGVGRRRRHGAAAYDPDTPSPHGSQGHGAPLP